MGVTRVDEDAHELNGKEKWIGAAKNSATFWVFSIAI
jgi:hypothetical protein